MKHWIVCAGLLAAACGGEQEPPPAEPAARDGRAETQSIRNTEAVGYSGDAIGDKIDGALDSNEEAAKRRREEAERQSE